MATSDSIKSLALLGPIAPKDEPAPGGFEASNRRLADLLQNLGHNVIECAYRGGEVRGSFRKLAAYHRSFRNIRSETAKHSSDTVYHLTPLYKQFLLWEFLLAKGLKKNGKRITIDLRAGRLLKDYAKFGLLYRQLFKRYLSLADAIAVEGERFIPFLQDIRPDLTIHHLPNFILDAEIPASLPPKPMDTVRFAYVGAVNEAKGVRHSVQLVKALHDRGIRVKFDVFGRVSSEFKDEMLDIIGDARIVDFHGPRSYGDIQQALSQSHFFLFLSHWYGEGHSNALTEAMSQGCVPIVTDHGFSKAVAGDAGILVDDRENLVSVIAQIERELQDPTALMARQETAWRRVKSHFSESAVGATLSQLYETGKGA